jgi:hypothetical protein
MAHKIAEANVEEGQIKSVSKKLPHGRIKVHLIYYLRRWRWKAFRSGGIKNNSRDIWHI